MANLLKHMLSLRKIYHVKNQVFSELYLASRFLLTVTFSGPISVGIRVGPTHGPKKNFKLCSQRAIRVGEEEERVNNEIKPNYLNRFLSHY